MVEAVRVWVVYNLSIFLLRILYGSAVLWPSLFQIEIAFVVWIDNGGKAMSLKRYIGKTAHGHEMLNNTT